MKRHDVYCGGIFHFDIRQDGYEAKASRDFRALLLEGLDHLMNPPIGGKCMINGNVAYVGPYYFETDDMQPEDIVRCEKRMIEDCTDAVFLLDDASCPGTVAELMYALFLGKALHIFYVRRNDSEETESDMHAPCWYPITFCRMSDPDTGIYPCDDYGDAVGEIQKLMDGWMQQS